MTIPKFNEFMMPMMTWLSDGKSRHYKEFSEVALKKFNITPEEQNIILNSGQPLFENRYGWAKTYLHKAGLLHFPTRGQVQITDLGIKEVKGGLKISTLKDLEKFEAYKNWKTESAKQNEGLDLESSLSTDISPEESIEQNFNKLNSLLQEELLDKIKKITPSDFEFLIVKLLTSMGYGGSLKDAGMVIGKSGDGGIDGIISEDRLGLSKIYIQAKRWEANVGDVEIGRFLGSLSSRGATKGVFVTTSEFTSQAKETIKNNRSSVEIVLINGLELTKLMIEYSLGVSVISNYQIKKIDNDFFE